jgi:hypothetical protein
MPDWSATMSRMPSSCHNMMFSQSMSWIQMPSTDKLLLNTSSSSGWYYLGNIFAYTIVTVWALLLQAPSALIVAYMYHPCSVPSEVMGLPCLFWVWIVPAPLFGVSLDSSGWWLGCLVVRADSLSRKNGICVCRHGFRVYEQRKCLSLEVMPLRMTLTPYFLIPYLETSDGYKTCSSQCGTIKYCLLTSLESE